MKQHDKVRILKVKHLPANLVGQTGTVLAVHGRGSTQTVSVAVQGKTYNLPVANVAPAEA